MSKLCPDCNSNASLYFQARDINRKISAESFDYYRCSNCKLLFLAPIPNNLGDFYAQDYYGIPSSIKALAAGAEFERYKIDIVKKFAQKGALLEIGPASGGFAYLAKEAGFDVEVIEMNKKCCEFLEKELGVSAINSSNEQDDLAKLAPKNVIALWHVIEHLQNPFGLFIEASKKIKQDGILVIAAPNPDALQFHILGKHWVHVDAPRHVYLIPKELLVQKAEALGLKLVFETTKDAGSVGWNKFGWQYSLGNKFSNVRIKKMVFGLGSLITFLLSPFEKIEGKGSAYTLVFMKI